ncbi:MAG: DUF3408 domain-containing protein [Candidatus Azobacteroides sp.]|nr:DUF3408 domain-containing protein [Candidatus Azobacteroides sp.]
MSTKRNVDDIDEEAFLNSIAERHPGYNSLSDLTAQKEQHPTNEAIVQTTSIDTVVTSEQSIQSETKQTGSKQRKASLEEFRQQFMQTPKIDNRKPAFISETIRNDLDRIVRLFGERGLSVSGLVENLTRHFLEIYKDDVEQWRKM